MASAASRSTQLILLISTCSFLLPLSLDAQETNNRTIDSPPPQTTFSFNFSDASSYDLNRDLRLQGDASPNGSLIDLNIDNGHGRSTGRMSYKYPVRFYDATTMASFSTRFTFEIVPDEPFPGDGMAFFLAGYPSTMGAGGANLGLYSDATRTPFVAVEFDTYQNDWDPDNKHIGIDINFLQSANTTTLPSNLTLKGTMAATITFDSISGMLVASLLFHDHPSIEPVVVSYKLQDPKSLLPPNVAVGFSGSTGVDIERHNILTWSFNSTFAAPTPPKGHRSIVLVIAVVAPLLALFICGIVSFKYIKRHRKGKGSQEDEALVWVVRSSEFMVYDFLQVLEATNNFSEENKLGQGGFGPVYKGRFHNGLEIAVKRLASHSGQGFREFKNEIELIAKLQHTNLVRLLGCCSQGDERLLIYEYMPNKSLDFYIFDDTRRALLDWNKRLAIIEGISQGILYLHKHSRLRVIHRDLKASNILLDHNMNPKISDFGLAKIFSLTDTEGNTKRIVGTYGYMAPEYASEGLFSIKSDVFSFGVLILEIISGKKTSSFHQYGFFINLLGHNNLPGMAVVERRTMASIGRHCNRCRIPYAADGEMY
ncbi:unnamed protein product [Urochloa humidicola]